MRSLPVYLILFSLLTACSVPQYVAVPVNYNAKFAFRTDTNTLLIVNQFDFSTLKLSSKKKLAVVQAAAFTAIKYAETNLGNLPHVKVINIADSTNFIHNSDSVKILAMRYHANYVLALKNFFASIDLSGIDGYNSYYNNDVSVSFLLYEDNGLFFKKLTDTANDASAKVPYVNILVSLLVHPTVKGNKEGLKASAEHAAYAALKDYLPYTITNNRPLYGDDYLKPVNSAILANNPGDAETLLKPFLQNGNAKVAGRAMYTLAVVYEMEGDIDGAYDMAQRSLKKYYNQYALAIIADLKNE